MILLLAQLALAEDPAPSVETQVPPATEAPPAPQPPAGPAPAPAPAEAAEAPLLPGPSVNPAPKPKALTVTHEGEVRAVGSLPPGDLVVDPEGATLGQGAVLDSRIRFGMKFAFKGVEAHIGGDFLDGQLAGDAWDIRGTEDARHRESLDPFGPGSSTLRHFSLGGRLGPVALEGGVVTSHWGLGMLANDGSHDPEFGRSDFGDRVIRLRVATKLSQTMPLFLAVAGDRVIEDESADWDPLGEGGEEAWQALASVVYGTPDAARGGVYGVYRNQMEIDRERHSQVGVLDLYGDVPFQLSRAKLRIAGEAASIFGRTSRAQSYNSRDGLDVQSAGLTGLVEAQHVPLALRVAIRGGWASGDTDPDDGYAEDFAFDRDFDVGMVMFDEVQGAVDAATYAQLTDPEHSGSAPNGAEALVAEGAFRHAAFVQPVVAITPIPWLNLKVGLTMAWSTNPPQQAFATYRAGGNPTNHLGVATSGYDLGTEVDWAVKVGDIGLGPKEFYRPALLIQGGHAFMADNLGGGTVTMLSAAARLRW
ncbi:hypothetical protein LBMAG42_15270 [Deltaproteobacteria bacterium]|nr:hypothetical protein LBMAG42_15270 [Deltaproteobacteria bacterium]